MTETKKKKIPKSPVTRTKPSIARENKNTRILFLHNLMKKNEDTFGMEVNWDEHRQGYVIVHLCDLSSAEMSGLKLGDRLVSIDSANVSGYSQDGMAKLMASISKKNKLKICYISEELDK